MSQSFLVMPHVWLKMLSSQTSALDPIAKKLKRMIHDDADILITGFIIQEVLHFISSVAEKERVYHLLDQMNYVELTKMDFYQASMHQGEDLFRNLHEVVAARLGAEIIE